jgi:hypothetical protein
MVNTGFNDLETFGSLKKEEIQSQVRETVDMIWIENVYVPCVI